MRRPLLLQVGLIFMLLCPVACQANAWQDLIILSGDDMAGRKPGTDGHARARNYIASRFFSIGLRPFNANFIVPFTYEHSLRTHTGYNVLGWAGLKGTIAVTHSLLFQPIMTIWASAALEYSTAQTTTHRGWLPCSPLPAPQQTRSPNILLFFWPPTPKSRDYMVHRHLCMPLRLS